MKVYRDISPLDKLDVQEASEASQMLIVVSVALALVLLAPFVWG